MESDKANGTATKYIQYKTLLRARNGLPRPKSSLSLGSAGFEKGKHEEQQYCYFNSEEFVGTESRRQAPGGG